LESTILLSATLYGSQPPEDSSPPWRLATWASFAKANSTAYLMHFFLKTIHLIKDSECQNIMNRFGLALKIILALEGCLHAISPRVGSLWYLVTSIYMLESN
jgi:hypothetical protein